VDSGPVPRVAAPPSPPNAHERPVPPPASPPFSAVPLAGKNARHTRERPGRPRCVQGRTGPVCLCRSSARAAAGTKPYRFCRNGEPLPWEKFSGGAAPADSSPAAAAACGIAVRAGAAHCGAGRRNCCRFPAARPARGASGRARDIRESNTAPSNRADIASVPHSQREPKLWNRKTPQNQRDCAP
jgi:hypothetical protein